MGKARSLNTEVEVGDKELHGVFPKVFKQKRQGDPVFKSGFSEAAASSVNAFTLVSDCAAAICCKRGKAALKLS